jgi:hypothetical protein
LLLLSLLAMALLGPRPSGFAARVGVALAMFAMTLYAGLALQNLSTVVLALTAAGGLTLHY